MQLRHRAGPRIALIMQSRGYSLREIAEGLGRTDKAVESMIAYAKRQIWHKTGRKGLAESARANPDFTNNRDYPSYEVVNRLRPSNIDCIARQ